MSLPPDQLRKLFSRRVRRGTVLRATISFGETGTVKPKYIVVMSKEPADADPLVFFITTSQLQAYERNAVFRENAVFLEANALKFFPRKTAINCRELYELPREEVQELVANGEADIIGDLPEETLALIDQIVRASILISLADKAKII